MYKPFFVQRLLGSAPPRPGAPSRAAVRSARDVASICHELQSQRGEGSGAFIAREALKAYQSLDEPALEVFFTILVKEFSLDPEAVGRSADAYRKEPSPGNLVRLQRAVESPRQELFRRLNMAPGGIGVLLEMRRRLLRGLAEHPHWADIETDLAHLFRSWFNRGFLVLERIDWRTSALILEKLIEYEAVHQIQGWRDLRRRLAADRRCYAFFHPALPDEPLIFIEGALTRGRPARVHLLIDPETIVADPAGTNCAVFYAITNCQEGLRGVSFGNFLIKQVAEDLGGEFPRLRTFATLSPIPGFADWLTATRDSPVRTQVSPKLAQWIEQLQRGDALDLDAVDEELRGTIRRLCAYYLLQAKRGKEPLDPVARFHLANGAQLAR